MTTADLNGSGAQDVIVPTTDGFSILDGPTGLPVADVDAGTSSTTGGVVPTGATYGFQNAPLVTADATGRSASRSPGTSWLSGATRCRASCSTSRCPVPTSGLADAAGGWPQFHHDSVAGFTGGTPRVLRVSRGGPERLPAVASDGGIFASGSISAAVRGASRSTAGGRPGGRHRPGRLLAGGFRRRGVHFGAPRSTDRPASLRLNAPSSAWRPLPMVGGVGCRLGWRDLRLRRRPVLRLGGLRPRARTSSLSRLTRRRRRPGGEHDGQGVRLR